MKIVLLCSLLFLSSSLMAQNFGWAKQFEQQAGTTMNGRGEDIITDAAGNVYSIGYYGGGSTDFDPGPAVHLLNAGINLNGYISKLDNNGNYIWGVGIEGPHVRPISITLDANGNIYVVGTFVGIATFYESNGNTQQLGNSATIDAEATFVSKFDNNGSIIWAKQFGTQSAPITSYVGVLSVILDAAGNVITTGFVEGTADFDPGATVYNLVTPATNISNPFVCKLDNDGNFVWAKQFSNSQSGQADAVCVDAAGNIYSNGTVAAITDFDPNAGTYSLGAGGYISKLDANGNFIFAKSMPGAICRSICFDGINLIISGNYMGTADLDPGPGIYSVSSAGAFDTDVFLDKVDTDGNLIWARGFGGPDGQATWNTRLDQLGNIYMTGSFGGVFDVDPGPGTVLLSTSSAEGFVCRFSGNGDLLWGYQTNSSGMGLSNNGTYAAAPDGFGNVFITGDFNRTTDFDPGTSVFNLYSLKEASYIVKLSNCINSSNSTITQTACGSYTLNTQTYNTSGSYIQHLLSTSGCDSIITLNLTINNPTTSDLTVTSCNSYTLNSQTYNSSGTYTQTLVNSAGCDSIITLHLLINQSTTSNLTFSGCNSYIYNGQTYSSGGTYTQTLVNSAGCDSVVTLNITINEPVNISIYDTAYNSYNWEGQSYTSSGVYTASFTGVNGCDSIRTLHLVIKQNCSLIIPNAITPNGDGINERWIISGDGINCYTQLEVFVYNRYGGLIYHNKSYHNDWEGTYHSKPVPDATYYYVVKAFSPNRDPEIFKGDLTVLR